MKSDSLWESLVAGWQWSNIINYGEDQDRNQEHGGKPRQHPSARAK